MIFPMAYVLMAAIFIVQLLLCRKARQLWVKLIPVALITLGELACVGGYAIAIQQEQAGNGIYGAAFAAVIYGCILLYLLAADAVAWIICSVVNFVQKSRK